MAIGKYNFKNHKKGDTLNPVQFTLIINGEPQPLDGMSINCMFKKKQTDVNAVLTLSIDSGISIVNEAQGIFKIDPGVVNIPAGTYYYDIQFTFTDNTVKTLIEGTLIVVQDITTT
jgi:hypothetical protein